MWQEHESGGLVVISVVVQDLYGDTPTLSDAGLWQDELDLTFPVVADVDGTFFPTWDPAGVLPTTVVVDPAGVVVWNEAGSTEDELARIEAVVLESLP